MLWKVSRTNLIMMLADKPQMKTTNKKQTEVTKKGTAQTLADFVNNYG